MKAKTVFELKSILAAFALMSRLPVNFFSLASQLSSEHHHRAQIWYPIVGLVLGLLLTLLHWILTTWLHLGVSPDLFAALLLILWVLFTGGLHLDGLADAADAWVGGMGDRDKTLAIMKDPSCGPAAVVTLVLVLLLKFILIAELLSSESTGLMVVAFVMVPTTARAWLLPLLGSMPYARSGDGGMASVISVDFPRKVGAMSFATVQLVACMLLWMASGIDAMLFVFLTTMLLCFLVRQGAMSRLQGYTGDLLGAAIELFELAILLAIVLVAL